VDKLLKGCEEFACGYIDDLAIFSHTWEDHLQHLDIVLGRIMEAGLTVKPNKCQLAEGKVQYLGKEVGAGSIAPQDEKIRCIKIYPLPSNKTELRGFLGLVGYYHKWIPRFAEQAAELTDLTKKSNPDTIVWNDAALRAFEQMRNSLAHKPLLRGPDYSKIFVIQTDASTRAVSAILSQEDDAGDEHPIAYASRKLLPRETRYAIVELELLAILFGVDKFKSYIWGQDVVIYTDHDPLKFLEKKEHLNSPRLTRWMLSLYPYRFVIKHRAGSKNGNADSLSRIELSD
jgi:hypothetical protein